MRRHWPWITGIIVLVLLIVTYASTKSEATVTVIQPYHGRIEAYIREQAVTKLPTDHLISMPIDGWLQPIELREGDTVVTGQVLCRLDPDDLEDRVRQVQQQIAVLETEIKQTQDNRLEEHLLAETQGVVKAMDEVVKAAEVQLEGSLAIYEFAQSELERIKGLSESDSAAVRELAQAKTEYRKTGADYRSDVLNLAALRALAVVTRIGPKFTTDYIDRKSFDLETYQRQLDEARAELEIVKRNLARTVITSPVDGVVLERHQTRRQYLAAGTPLLTIGNLDDIEVIAEVLTERAPRIQPGAQVEIFGEALPEVVPGTVLRVYPAGFKKISSLGVEQQRVNVAISLAQRPPRLGVGYRVDVRIIYDQAEDAIIIPRTCLFRDDAGNWQVMVVRGGTIALAGVRTGIMNDDHVEITSGLTAEDQVILHPTTQLEAGMRVKREMTKGER